MSSLTLVKILEIIAAHEAAVVHLRSRAAAIRAEERHDAIKKIRMSIVEHQFTGSECGFTNDRLSVKQPIVKESDNSKIRYRNELGQTWSGGRGRRPAWIVDALISGKSIKQYSVFSSTLKSAGKYMIYS